MSNFAEATNAYRFHQVADLIDSFPALNDVTIHSDDDSLNFFVSYSKLESEVAAVKDALASWGVTEWDANRSSNYVQHKSDVPICGFEDFTIFVMGGTL